MKHRTTFSLAVALVILVCAGVMWNQQTTGASASQSQKLATLKELRANGLLSDDEYQAKVAEITGSAAAPQPVSISAATRTVDIGDPQLGMRAATLEIPADWKFGGAIVRTGGCHADGARFQYSAQSPDGLLAVQLYPSFVWNNTGTPPMKTNLQGRVLGPYPPVQGMCPPADISSAEEYLRRVALPNLRPHAALVNIGPFLPQDQEMLERRLATLREGAEREAAHYPGPRRNHPDQHMLDGAIAYLRYSINGHEVDEAMRIAVHCRRMWVNGSMVATPSEQIYCNSWPVVVMRAPRGTLLQTVPRLAAIAQSSRVDSNWDFRMGQIIQQQGQQMIAASNAAFQAQQQLSQAQADARTQQHNQYMAQQQGQFNQHEQYMAQQQHNSDANLGQFYAHQGAMDKAAHQTVVYALDQRAFIDTKTGNEYDISNKANNAFLGSDGTVVWSAAPINPVSTVPGISYSQLEAH